MKNLGKRIGGTLLTLAFAFGISAATVSTAAAQYRNDDGRYQRRDRNRDGDNNRDRNRRRRRDRNDDWRRERSRNQNRSTGYGRNGGYGNYGTYGRYGNNGYYNANQIEVNRGYQAGLNTGSSDARRGQSFNPERSHYYKNARSQAFVQGFLQGYDQGYRQYAGYGNGRYRRNTGGILGGIFGRP
jgi:hypothetical protein